MLFSWAFAPVWQKWGKSALRTAGHQWTAIPMPRSPSRGEVSSIHLQGSRVQNPHRPPTEAYSWAVMPPSPRRQIGQEEMIRRRRLKDQHWPRRIVFDNAAPLADLLSLEFEARLVRKQHATRRIQQKLSRHAPHHPIVQAAMAVGSGNDQVASLLMGDITQPCSVVTR